MKKIIYLLALVALLSAAPRVMALAQTSQAIDLAQREVIAQQKKQDTQLKALEAEAAKLLGQQAISRSNRIGSEND